MSSPTATAILVTGARIAYADLFPPTPTHHAFCRKHCSSDEWYYVGAKETDCPEHLSSPFCPNCGQPSYVEVPRCLSTIVEGQADDFSNYEFTYNGLVMVHLTLNEDVVVLAPPFAIYKVEDDSYRLVPWMALPHDFHKYEEVEKECFEALNGTGLRYVFGTFLVAQL